jgi:hypothetical protein
VWQPDKASDCLFHGCSVQDFVSRGLRYLLHKEWKMHLMFKTVVVAYFTSLPNTEEKVQGRIKVTGIRGRRCKQLLDDLKAEAPKLFSLAQPFAAYFHKL